MKLNIAELFENKEAELTEKIIDMYLGEQEEYVVKLLSDPQKGRKDWQTRGIIPRHRNIIKMIIDKNIDITFLVIEISTIAFDASSLIVPSAFTTLMCSCSIAYV